MRELKMNDDILDSQRDLRRIHLFVHVPLWIAGLCMIAVFIGHKSFGLPDFGITIWHLITLWVVHVSLLWIATSFAGKRMDNRIRAMRYAASTGDDIRES